MHLNPNVKGPVETSLGALERCNSIAPQDYLPFVHLMGRADMILTDSGGVQEEAPTLGKPVLVMRDTTERPEAVDAGTVKLVGTDADLIVGETNNAPRNPAAYEAMSRAHNPYGDGLASQRIRDAILSYFSPYPRITVVTELPFKRISVIGLGYIGLPTAAMFASRKSRSWG